MPRITVHVSETVDEWLTSEKERTGTSKAKLGGECIELMHSDVNHIEEARSDVMQSESLAARVDELEERLEQLETSAHTPADYARAHDQHRDADERGDDPSVASESESLSDAHSASERDEVIEELVRGLYEGQSRREARREAGEAALEWLRGREGTATAQEFKDALYADYRSDGENEDTWWRKNARPAITEARDRGLVNYHNGRKTYRWVGDGA